MNGIIVVYKEAGFTSHDVVAKMRGICGQRKAGHTGTLDPEAEGVLPVCLGSATRVCGMLADQDKEYVAELLLGVETDTQDATGRLLARRPVETDREGFRRTAEEFLGEYLQTPPMYSALKVDGRRLYELARAGKEVERQPRTVWIRELEILDCSLPAVTFRVVCSKGTYIRTLCADMGERLGCGGIMKSLKRTRAGRFGAESASTLGRLQQLKEEGRLEEALLPTDSVFEECPPLHIREEFRRLADNGNAFLPEQTLEGTVYGPGRWVRIYRQDESFVGIYAYDPGRKWYRPVKMFL